MRTTWKMTRRMTVVLAGIFTLTLAIVLYGISTLGTSAVEPTTTAISLATNTIHQNETLQVDVSGFAANEAVTLWQTFPDYRVLPLQSVETNDDGTATVQVFMDSSLPTGTHAITARGNQSNVKVIAEFSVQAPATPISEATIVATNAVAYQGGTATIDGKGYVPSEPVSLWLTLPDGAVRNLDITEANKDGVCSYTVLFNENDPTGTYYITGFGRTSQRTGIGTVQLERGDFLPDVDVEAVSLEIWPMQVRQLDVVTLTGRGFEKGEVVGLWMTLPDGTVATLYEGTTMTGAFQEQIFLPAVIPEGGLPAGVHTFSAYGKTSNRRATTTLELLPGEGL